MILFLLSLLSIAFSAITYIPAVNWLSIVGFVFGITAWVMGRKIWQTNPAVPLCKASMVLGIVGTFACLVGIVLSFVWGNLMSGGGVVF